MSNTKNDRINLLTIVFIIVVLFWGAYAYKNDVKHHEKIATEIAIKEMGEILDGSTRVEQAGTIGTDQAADGEEIICKLPYTRTSRNYKYWANQECISCREWEEAPSDFHCW